jgi:hypothetical protein
VHAARDQYAPLLAARQLEKAARCESSGAEPAQNVERSLTLAGGGPAARDVRAIDSRQHDVERREVPRAARVTILQLVPDQHDLASRAHGVGLLAGAEIVTPDPTFRRGPDRARDEA